MSEENQVVESEVIEQESTQTDSEQVENSESTENAEPEKTFTQSELDEIIQKRIERERESVTKKVSQAARDDFIAEQGYEWKGKKITTEDEYKQAIQEQQLIEKYKDQDLPDDVIQELVESKKFREQYQEDQKRLSQQEKQQKDFKDFITQYPDVKTEDIPASVWEDYEKGMTLVDAYVRHENKSLKEKLAEFEEGKKAEQQNQENAESSTGSVSNDGGGNAYFTREQVGKMSTEEINRNWAAINESMKKWKG